MNGKLIGWFSVFLLALLFSSSSLAENKWGAYHWASASSPITLKVIDSTTAIWDGHRIEMQGSWSLSTVLDLKTDSSNSKKTTRLRCKFKSGQLRICNAFYGNTGWLGIAEIYVDSNAHIIQARVALNDSYVGYWDTESRNHVMCQEIGHALGLHHTSTNGTSQQTCMDYSKDPLSQYPNAHDYELLLSIYGHTDGYNSFDDEVSGSCSGRGCRNKSIGSAVMGVKVVSNAHYEIWVAPGKDGGLIINHLYLAE